MAEARRALVTGGAGGIGRMIVKRLAASGYRVSVVDMAGAEGEKVSVESGAARYTQGDVTDRRAVWKAIEDARDGGTLHVVVNCSGISPKKDGRSPLLTEIELAEWERVMAVNLTAPFLVIQQAAPYLEDGASSIVNIVSIMAKLGSAGPPGVSYGPFSPSGAHYSASKAGLKNLTASVARELAPRGIRCNAVAPGFVAAGMTAATSGKLEATTVAQVPLGRAATADDVAAAVAFLVSDDAQYITGETIDVDGGWCPD
jgi:NAD(P)-dependent dehydrogenase (short-subunit alcohol dehydrogenase family)